jgi:hypothetical protein
MEAVVEQVSQALERTRLIEQTQKSAVNQTVARVSSASSSILTQSIFAICRDSQRIVSTCTAHVYLLDDSGEN